MQNADTHLVVADLFQRLNDGLGRALHVGFDHHGQFGDVLVGFRLGQHLVQRDRGTGSSALVLGGLLAVVRDLAGLRFGFHHVQHVAGSRSAVQTQNLDRNRGAGLIDALALVVDQRAHLAPLFADDEDVATTQGTVLHQNRRDRATAHVQLGLDHRALRRTIRVGAQFKDFRLQGDGFQKLVQTLAGLGRNLDVLHVARHGLNDHLVLQQRSADFLRIGGRLVDLVDRNDHRHLGGLGVIDCLDRLRHHGVIGRNHQHDDIRHLRTTGPHRGKRGVAGRIQECQGRAVRGFHLIGPDMLGDPAGFARDDAGLADRIQKRGLAVVDVTHDRDDRGARLQILVLVLDLIDHLLDIGIRNADSAVAEFVDHQLGGIGVHGLVAGDHQAHAHQRFDDIGRALSHPVRQFRHQDGFRQLHIAHLLFLAQVAAHGFLPGFFLLALHGGKRTLAAAFAVHRLAQRQLAGATAVVAVLVAAVAVIGRGAVALGLARRGGGDTLGFGTRSRRFGRSAVGGGRTGLGSLGLADLGFFLGAHLGLAGAALVLFGLQA